MNPWFNFFVINCALFYSVKCTPFRTTDVNITSTFNPETTPYETTSISTQYSTQQYTTFQASHELITNISLNFTSTAQHTEAQIEEAVKTTFESVLNLPDSFLYVHSRNYYTYETSSPPEFGYFCSLIATILADSYSTAQHYEKLLQSDGTTSQSNFETTLSNELNVNTTIHITWYFDIESFDSGSSKDNNTTAIIIWFLGASAVCAIVALILIMCWRRINTKKEEHESINLDSLLNPNATNIQDSSLLRSPMHIQPYDNQDNDNDNNNKQNSNQNKKNGQKRPSGDEYEYFQRLDDDNNNDQNNYSLRNDANDDNNFAKRTRSHDESVDDDNDDENPYIMHNFSERSSKIERI